jgi:hypothetical protein
MRLLPEIERRAAYRRAYLRVRARPLGRLLPGPLRRALAARLTSGF